MINGHSKNETKRTAHQLWSDQIYDNLNSIIRRKEIRDKVIAFVINHSTTRLRIVTDEMILLLTQTDEAIKVAEQSFKGTPFWRFKLKRELGQDYQKLLEVRKAYQKAVLVLVNTPPPPAAASDVAVMKANKD
jgi:hypothetical protein